MAGKRTAEAVETEVVENKNDEVKEETYKIMLPLTKELQDDVFVGINGKSYQLQRGVEVEVNRAVYEVLLNSQKMDNLAIARSNELAKGNL